jgi:hypothetical protein
MKIIKYPPDPAAEDARSFVDEAFRTVDWNQFQDDIWRFNYYSVFSPELTRDVRNFMNVTLRRLIWGFELSPVEYLVAARVLEDVCNAILGPLEP